METPEKEELKDNTVGFNPNTGEINVKEVVEETAKDETAANEEVPLEGKGKKVDLKNFGKQPETQKQSMLQRMSKKIGILAQYIEYSEKSTSDRFIGHGVALRVLYDEVFKECRRVHEVDIDKEDGKFYAKIIGHYFMFKKDEGEEVVKIIPIETGWDIVDQKPGEPTEIDDQKFETVDVTFKFNGVVSDPEAPTEKTFNCIVGTNPTMQLKGWLFSLKEKKIIM